MRLLAVRPATLLSGLLLRLLVLNPSSSPSTTSAAAGPATASCRAHPGDDSSWPSPSTWAGLDAALREQRQQGGGGGGRLFRPSPPGAACHVGQPEYDPAACRDAASRWTSYAFHADHPASMMWDTFSNETCMPDAARSCTAHAYPAYVVNATAPVHVKTAIDFGEFC